MEQQYICEAIDPESQLKPKYRQILKGVGEGKTDPQMAEEYHRSPETIKKWRKETLHEFGANNAPSLIALAVARGILSVSLIKAAVCLFSFLTLFSLFFNDDHVARIVRNKTKTKKRN